ncbi:BMP family ABC transporter substrate-binding protein [Sneathiella chinensis]|uniref:BMP family ABC transporter substrate-binding protein n=1 Tax=Sneathiella chinensis TaxID=349750 RepID=A0ABQ5U4D9_9PROT|nr:BMP family ABC transporter substrate-binding protein [Sneathiella chinensis]GLQ06144.1 BMP family ABC transporter substrate-binding protein [Sneathiella chinensis]
MKLKNIASLMGAAVVAGGMLAAGSASAQDKIGFVYVGPIGDHGWTYRHDVARQAVEKAFDGKVKTTFVESVKEGPDSERVIRQMAADGHKLIFTTSFGFMNPTIKVAKQFPDVKFEHATGYKRADNVSTYSARFYEGRYVVGKVAAKMTKSNIIGYVGSFPIPEVVRGINATALGARSVNPNVEIKVAWVNTWYDPGKEGDAAKALIDQGADIIMQHTDSPAPLQVAESRGVYGVGQASDMQHFAPKAQLTAIIDDWNDYYVTRAKAAFDGSWKSQDLWGGFKDGLVALAPYNEAIPADVVAMAEETRKAIMDGSVKPFAGPFNKQDGTEAVAAGAELDDAALLGMDWYVEGIQGKLPK